MSKGISVIIRPSKSRDTHVVVECKELKILITNDSMSRALDMLHTELSDQVAAYSELEPAFLSEDGAANQDALLPMQKAIYTG